MIENARGSSPGRRLSGRTRIPHAIDIAVADQDPAGRWQRDWLVLDILSGLPDGSTLPGAEVRGPGTGKESLPGAPQRDPLRTPCRDSPML